MLAQRLASAAVGIPLILLLVYAGGPWYTAAAALVLALAALEFQAARHGWRNPISLLAAGFAGAIAGGAHVGPDWVWWFSVGAIVIPLCVLALTADPVTAFTDWLWATGGILYVGSLGSFIVLLRHLDNGRDWVYLALLTTFATDTFAYAGGRLFGHRPMAPRVSPSKTWEGAASGVALGFGAATLFNYLLGIRLEAALIIPLALLTPVAAVVGDLAESMIKRGMQIKDASALIPGHGGFLDRLDSLLFTFAVVYFFRVWVVP